MSSFYLRLRRKHQRFVDEYVACGVGAEAVRRIFPNRKRPDQLAWEFLQRPGVKEAIEERKAEAIAAAGVHNVRVLQEAARLAFADLGALRNEKGERVTFKDLPADFLAGVQSIEFDANGQVSKVRLNKVEGLRMLGAHLKLFSELHEHTGADGGPIKTESAGSELEVARRLAFLLQRGLRAQQSAPESEQPERS